ncbi:small terminase [Lactococcus phage 17W12M]|uniref:Small terminase n=1 Tax=Lactococcus phage 17W12M TaxID=1874574 RepID=A0A3G1FGV9_9CAUD|nr:small terminase [Lactococcus phage 17W12M]
MQKQNGGRPTILPKMYEEPLFSQIIDKIESGCNDREIYTSLHCSAKTFRKWRDDNIKAYDEAKSIARGNLLELAESALASSIPCYCYKIREKRMIILLCCSSVHV